MNKILHDKFELYFSYMLKDVDYYKELNDYDLVVKTKDGRTFLYDSVENAIRKLPKDSNNLTKQECSREFGKRLYNIMYRKGFTESKLSSMTGIPQPMISSYITGKTTPSFYKVDKIAKALGCSVDDFRYFD